VRRAALVGRHEALDAGGRREHPTPARQHEHSTERVAAPDELRELS